MTPKQQQTLTRVLFTIGLICVVGGLLPTATALMGVVAAPTTPAGWVGTALLGLPALLLGGTLLALAAIARQGGFS